jgi:hypothetical protein
MAKAKTQYTCTSCGAIHNKWNGQCADCQAWNTLEESIVQSSNATAVAQTSSRFHSYSGDAGMVKSLSEIDLKQVPRTSTKISELDRVLGGGLVQGSVTLGNLLPQTPTGRFTAVSNHESHNLAGFAGNRSPDPAYAVFFEHERPHLIQFQNVIRLSGKQRLAQVRQSLNVIFHPTQNGAPGNLINPFQPPQTGSFFVRLQDRFFLFRSILVFGFQYATGPAVFAVVLLAAALVVPIFHYVGASAPATCVGDDCLYHVL